MSEKSKCCTCGYEWETGQDGSHSCVDRLLYRIDCLREAMRTNNSIIHDQIVAMQAAWIEWEHGKGAEAAMERIHNTLWQPGNLPDENAPYGKDPDKYHNANLYENYIAAKDVEGCKAN